MALRFDFPFPSICFSVGRKSFWVSITGLLVRLTPWT